jgi:hypothetical protein
MLITNPLEDSPTLGPSPDTDEAPMRRPLQGSTQNGSSVLNELPSRRSTGSFSRAETDDGHDFLDGESSGWFDARTEINEGVDSESVISDVLYYADAMSLLPAQVPPGPRVGLLVPPSGQYLAQHRVPLDDLKLDESAPSGEAQPHRLSDDDARSIVRSLAQRQIISASDESIMAANRDGLNAMLRAVAGDDELPLNLAEFALLPDALTEPMRRRAASANASLASGDDESIELISDLDELHKKGIINGAQYLTAVHRVARNTGYQVGNQDMA